MTSGTGGGAGLRRAGSGGDQDLADGACLDGLVRRGGLASGNLVTGSSVSAPSASAWLMSVAACVSAGRGTP